MDITLETVGDVDRRERLLGKSGLRPRVLVVLEAHEAEQLREALRDADYQHCDASLSLDPAMQLLGGLTRVLETAPAQPGEDS